MKRIHPFSHYLTPKTRTQEESASTGLVHAERVMGQRRQIAGSRILITGASQGIGRALAEEASLRGGKVLAAARSEELLRELAEQVRARGGILETVLADVTSPEGRQRMVDAAVQHFGGLD